MKPNISKNLWGMKGKDFVFEAYKVNSVRCMPHCLLNQYLGAVLYIHTSYRVVSPDIMLV